MISERDLEAMVLIGLSPDPDDSDVYRRLMVTLTDEQKVSLEDKIRAELERRNQVEPARSAIMIDGAINLSPQPISLPDWKARKNR